MQKVDIVQQLVEGQGNMDRIRHEVKQVVGMLLGLIIRRNFTFFPFDNDGEDAHENKVTLMAQADSQKFTWYLWPTDFGARESVHIECWKWQNFSRAGNGRSLIFDARFHAKCGFSSGERSEVSVRHAIDVHQALAGLIEGVMSRSPEISRDLLPFLEAAGYQF